MSDQTSPDQASPTSEGGSVDVSARLASLTAAPRPAVASIWPRREASQPPPVADSPSIREQPTTETMAAGTTAPAPASTRVSGGGVGRLTRVSAAELWSDASVMAAWIASNADALGELIGVDGLQLQPPTDGTVTGSTGDGGTVCIVCEVGASTDEGLGTLLRTAAVQAGGTVLWLNGEASDSHVAALSWLNRSTPPRFFLVKATGVRIGESASAPMFELVVRPPRSEAPDAGVAAPRRRVEDHVPAG